MATLKELDTYYTYEDALTLFEILTVNNHNEQMIYKAIQEEREKAK